jgi:hypothetical protein
MAHEERSVSVVDDRPGTIVLIPDAAPRPVPGALDVRPVPWIDRRQAPWVVAAAVISLVALLLLLQAATSEDVTASEARSGAPAIDADLPSWTALSLPVPESDRTRTANVHGDLDVIAVANLAPGAASGLVGSVTTADGSTVQQVFGDHAFSIASQTGAALVVYVPYQAGDALILEPGREVTFVGTLMPVPADFAAMVGTEASIVGARTNVYVRLIPETLRIVTTVPETS